MKNYSIKSIYQYNKNVFIEIIITAVIVAIFNVIMPLLFDIKLTVFHNTILLLIAHIIGISVIIHQLTGSWRTWRFFAAYSIEIIIEKNNNLAEIIDTILKLNESLSKAGLREFSDYWVVINEQPLNTYRVTTFLAAKDNLILLRLYLNI